MTAADGRKKTADAVCSASAGYIITIFLLLR